MSARKIAATLASTGTPAHYVHPAEASHGDLGMVQPDDVDPRAVLVGRDGGARRPRRLCEALSRAADRLDVQRRLDPRPRRPMSALALPQGRGGLPERARADDLDHHAARARRRARGGAAGEARLHGASISASSIPGGKLGAQLKLVRDVMHGASGCRSSAIGTLMAEAIVEIGRKGFGCGHRRRTPDGTLAGIVTDGDLRRQPGPDLARFPVDADHDAASPAPSRPTPCWPRRSRSRRARRSPR